MLPPKFLPYYRSSYCNSFPTPYYQAQILGRFVRNLILGILGFAFFGQDTSATTFITNFENGTVGASVPVSTPLPEPSLLNANPSTSTSWNGSTLGNYIASGYQDPGTNYIFGPNSKVAVLADNSASGASYFYFQGPSNDPVTSGQLSVTWDMMFKSTGQSGNCWTNFVNANNQVILQIMWSTGGLLIYEYAQTPGVASATHSGGTYPMGTKLTMCATFDLSGNTCKVTMNGFPLKNTATLQSVFAIPPASTFSGTKFFTSDPATRVIAIDNFRSQRSLAIVTGGANPTSSYKIYRSSSAPQTVIDAALDIQHVIQGATGVTLPIDTINSSGNIISVGDNAKAAVEGFTSTALPLEGFQIATKGTNVYILGRDTPNNSLTPDGGFSRGTLNGVSTFLQDEVGVRWLLPGVNGEDIPNLAGLLWVKNQNTVQEPHFICRLIRYAWNTPPNATDVQKWMNRSKLGQSINIGVGHAWDETPSQGVLNSNPAYMAQLSPDPTLTRQATTVAPLLRKYCTTNTGLIDAFAQNLYDQSPSPSSFSMSPTDGAAGCCCSNPDCVNLIQVPNPGPGPWGNWGGYAHSRTPQMIAFYNAVANALENKFIANNKSSEWSGKKLGGYLYANYSCPPATFPSLNSHVYLFYAPRTYYGMLLYKPQHATDFQNIVNLYGQHYGGQMGYADYACWLRDYIGAPLPPSLSIINMIIQTHKNAGTRQMIFNSNSAWGWTGLRHYVLAKLMWNPNLNVNDLKAEWLTRTYGPAGTAMGQIYDLLDSGMSYYMNNRPVISPDFMTELTSAVIAGTVAPNYWNIQNLYLQADAQSLTSAQRARLQMFGDNMTVLCWRLRHMGMPNMSSSTFYKDDTSFNTWKTQNATSMALEETWKTVVENLNDNPSFNVTYDTAAAPCAVATAAPSPGINTCPYVQVATPLNPPTQAGTGTEICIAYNDNDLPAGTPFGTTKPLVLRDNSTSAETEVYFSPLNEADAASLGIMEVRWKMMVASNSSTGNYFVSFNSTERKPIASIMISMGSPTTMTANTYTVPGVPASAATLSNYTKGTPIDMKVQFDFTAYTAKYYVNGALILTKTIPQWSDLLEVKIASTPTALGTIATDDWYIGR